MDADELPDWTLEEHLAAGETALASIDDDHAHVAPQPVCHHFYELNPVDPMVVSVEATYSHLVPRFSALGLELLADRLEAWETTKPDKPWLRARIPEILHTAATSGLGYQGWTWEPRNRQPIGATNIHIINNSGA
ncbi:hypothetical protein [Sphingomonas sp. LaA6.9]|uniref:hypothetical protein n=1 Tax=Sphingomonas sp. LaA6.9 TaxID=2919914 RepID=UPI001F5010DE|nr:hypothetical protein [Sphingomonas sp. LaA6.9]MCJ8156801.1 hypothetical protein [Sphingomonas sp. LaA6.9]